MVAMCNEKRIKLFGALAIICFLIFGFTNVKALELNYSSKSNPKVKKVANSCSDKTNKCVDIASTYGIKVDSDDTAGENIVVNITYTSKKNGSMTSNPTANDFIVYVNREKSDETFTTEKANVTFTKSGDYYKASLSLDSNTTSGEQIVNIFVFSNNNQLCCATTESDANEIIETYVKDGHSLSGAVDEKGNKITTGIVDSNGKIISKYYGKSVYVATVTYSNDNGEGVVFEDPIEITIDTPTSTSSTAEGFDISNAELKNPSEVQKFTCDPFKVPNKNTDGSTITYADYVASGGSLEYFVNKPKAFYYNKKETTTEGTVQCEKDCTEIITVEYGPPVASIAGFCFEYAVKVTSKQKCEAKVLTPPPGSGNYKTCTVAPKCNNKHIFWFQAGPNEEFDDCIISCDGGKYSEKCTNKCYNKVYGKNTSSKNKTSKTMFSTNDYSTKNMAYSCNNNDALLCDKSSNVISHATELSNLAMNSNLAYYTKENGKIKWDYSQAYTNDANGGSGAFWLKLGRFYLTPAKVYSTVTAIAGSGEKRGFTLYKYYPDDDGFKRAYLNRAHTISCTENCYWFVVNNGYCTTNNVLANGYYNDAAVSNVTLESTGKTYVNVHNPANATPVNGTNVYVFMNKTDAEYVYASNISNYKQDAAKCLSQANCEKTQQTVFTIEVNYKQKGKDEQTLKYPLKNADIITTKNEWLNYPGTNKPSDSVESTILNADNGTCINSAATYPYNYHVDWSFPGTWINNKNGNISYESKESTAGWKLNRNKFCLPLDLESANTKWYEWKINGAAEGPLKEAAKSSIDYNIKAYAKDFGKFNWNIDISCFYGNPPNGDEPPQYKIRTVDLNNLFPVTGQSSDTGNINKTYPLTNSSRKTVYVGEEPGYNWTSAVESTKKEGTVGTNPKANENYVVDPVALIGKIQDEPTYVENNIDYQFEIGKEEFDIIRKYYKNDKSSTYTTFTNNFVGDDPTDDLYYRGVQSYKSPLITSLGNNCRRRAIGCNNSLSLTKCEVIK